MRSNVIQLKNNAQIDADMAQQNIEQLSAPSNTPAADDLAHYIRGQWSDAREAKRPYEEDMLKALRQRKGEYPAAFASALQELGAADVFFRLTDSKCRAAKAWIDDVLHNSGENPWTVDPTPVSELRGETHRAMQMAAAQQVQEGLLTPEEAEQLLKAAEPKVREAIQQDAKERAERMETRIKDQMLEGKFKRAIDAFIDDFVTHNAAFLLGPITKKQKKLVWENAQAVVKEALTTTWRRVSPLDVYPSPTSVGIEDGDILIHERFTQSDLYGMMGLPGVRDDMINWVLTEYGERGLNGWLDLMTNEHEKDRAEGRYYRQFAKRNTIDGLRFMGQVPGRTLAKWGIRDVEDTHQPYQVEAILIKNYVVRVRLNPDPLGRKNLFKACAIPVPGAFWGQTLPSLMEDQQDIVNYAARALSENMGMASGPQVGVDMNNVDSSADTTKIYPWKVWHLNTKNRPSGAGAGLPIHFFQPQMHAQELLGIMREMGDWSDIVTGIPAYMGGGQTMTGGGAADTASGLSMLLGNAAKGIREMLLQVGTCIEDIVERQYDYNMLYSPDESIKGDAQVKTGGFMALLQQETKQMRRKELLEATNNPTDMAIIGLAGRAELLRETIKGAEIDAEKVVPKTEEMMQSAQPLAAGVQPGATPEQPQSGEGARVADGMV